MKYNYLALARITSAGTLIYYAIEKIIDPVSFFKAIREYNLISDELYPILNLVVSAIPITEALAAFCLITGLWRRAAGIIVSGLIALFSIAILLRTFNIMAEQNISFAEVEFDCGCGSGEVIIWQKIIMNIALIVIILFSSLINRDAKVPTA